MLIYVKRDAELCDKDTLPEWAIVELQGTVQGKPGNEVFEEIVGNLHFSKKNFQPVLILGHHVLVGKELKLEQPMAVLEKASSDNRTEYVVKAIIKKKLIFKSRPKPIITNFAVQV